MSDAHTQQAASTTKWENGTAIKLVMFDMAGTTVDDVIDNSLPLMIIAMIQV